MSECAVHFRSVADRLEKDGWLDPGKVLRVDANTLKYQVPGGMLSNLIGQLKQANAMDKFYDVLAEVPRVREDFGYPPLVTPDQPDRRHAGRHEHPGRRALQDGHQGIQGSAARRVRAACPPR